MQRAEGSEVPCVSFWNARGKYSSPESLVTTAITLTEDMTRLLHFELPTVSELGQDLVKVTPSLNPHCIPPWRSKMVTLPNPK